MRKTLKYLMLLLLLLLLLCSAAIYYLLYTTSGSQQAIRFLISNQQWPMTVQSIEGYLGGDLQIRGMQYTDQTMDVEVEQLTYQLDWSWWQRTVDVRQLNISGVRIKQSLDTENEGAVENRPSIELPLILKIQGLNVTDIHWQQADQQQHIKQLSGGLFWQGDALTVETLHIEHSQLQANLTGQMRLHEAWPLTVQANWQWSTDETPVSGELSGDSQLSGDLTVLKGHHQLVIDSPELNGELVVLTELTLAPEFSASIQLTAGDHLTWLQEDHPWRLTVEQAEASGTPAAFVYSVAAAVTHPDFPPGQLSLHGQGNQHGMHIKDLTLSSAGQNLQAMMELSWSPDVAITGQLGLIQFNPATWGWDQSADLSGQLMFAAEQVSDDWQLELNDLRMSGSFQNRDLELTGSGQWRAGDYQADDLSLTLGNNVLFINGQANRQTVDASLQFDWPDLSALDQSLSGGIEAELDLSGSFGQPAITGTFNGTEMKHNDLRLAGLNGTIEGVLQDSVQATLNVTELTAGDVQVEQLQASLTGWLDAHQLELTFSMDDILTRLNLSGAHDQASSDVLWQGVINEHQVTLADGRQVVMNQPMQISWGDVLTLSEACWTGVNAGQLCVRSDQISATGPLTGEITLQAFSTEPFSPFLPERLKLSGLLNGQAGYRLDDDQFWLQATMALNDGILRYQTAGDDWLEQRISQWQLSANTSQQVIDLKADVRLADDSFLHWQSNISRAAPGSSWMLDADMSGQINSPELIPALTAEVSEAKGVVLIEGQVTGPLLQPHINWQLSQPDGYLKLTRMGTRIEQSVMRIETRRSEQLIYDIGLTGSSQSDRKQGRFALHGSLIMQPQWRFSGQLSGEDFRVLNLPELTLDVSPQLQVEASQAEASISGELAIPYGHVVIKTLPPESVPNSRDLVVIRDEQPDEDETPYPVLLDIKARIEDRVELDVIGLTAGLSGNLNLRQGPAQQLTGYGDLKLLDGRYEVYGQSLAIETGELNFSGALDNPRLNVRASRQATTDAVKAGVKLGGMVNQLQSELYSEPPMQDVEKLAYIMTGQGLEGAGNLDSEALKQAAIVLGLNQSSPVFRQIQQQFGIDVLTVKRNGDQSESVIEAGKKINDDLYIAWNQGLFNRLGFWVLKYRINEYLNLQTTQGDDQSIELVYTRRSEPPREQ